ncbi:hypothetical protein CPJCM30710_06340 [Clostridium polyendosporum]|uniref:Rqc2 homolog RqcH n=1 Tax=Clostridium polyendosporum TaxID=69208 RepID=A0A919RZS0_9CLOT|nr:NFACT RNA binding domain-containing protein [Clostridium polyendosporum]GIM27968.1 hypothetical protein CPJCM30710_06340 [Clostridium polyendosporum]
MALDGVFLSTLISNLKSQILNCKIDKVNQPEKDEIVLSIRGNKNSKLLISSSATYPRIHFTKHSKTNPLKAPMFCMVLRKYLIGGRIINVHQQNCDRIIIIDIETSDELGFNSIYSLIIEIMGRHSNISLVRQRDNRVMESIKHITPDINSYRSLYPGVTYIYPPESNKLNPFCFSKDDLDNMLTSCLTPDENFFSKIFMGTSKILSQELFVLFTKKYNYNFSLDNLFVFIQEFFKMLNSNICNTIYYESSTNKYKDFYCIKLESLKNYDLINYNDPSQLLDDFYSEKDKQDRLHARSIDLQRLINTNIERCIKKSKILENTLQECGEKEDLRIKGELLTSYIYEIEKGAKEVSLLNYYSETTEYIAIKLDENKTPSENIQNYFKKYTKLKKSEETAVEQLKKNKEELEYLNSVMTNLLNTESYNEIEEIKNELIESGYIKFKRSSSKNPKPSKPLHFISSDGIDIYVGKNNIQNDYLTLKFADKNDTWLHTKDIPGSHVIIKGTNLPDKTLEEAALLAAYYSKAKNSSKVPIDYTQVRNVKKPSGSKPGMVIYYTNKTMYVTPVEPKIKRVQ